MYQIQKTFTFEASHKLHHHDGKCAHLHGHSYRVTICLEGPSLQTHGPQTNMLCDFKDISDTVKPLIHKYLDHRHLNDTLGTDSPTAEFIARWIFEKVQTRLPLLERVMVHETASSVAIYSRRRPCSCHYRGPPSTEHEFGEPNSDDSGSLLHA